MTNKQAYDESSIAVLKGLEPVRLRPGMYTRTESPLHIVQEALDNAADEALGGYAKSIRVTAHEDGAISIADNGRGIPIGIHPEEGVPTVEVVFTRLHAGGKFTKSDGGAYAFSGGLHGVGVSVTNALSSRLEVDVVREGALHRIVFSEGEVVEPLARIKDMPAKASGTRVKITPNPKYFDSHSVPLAELEKLVRSKAILMPGLKVIFANEKTKQATEYHFEDGLKGYLSASFEGETITPVIEASRFAVAGDENFHVGEGANWAVLWTAEGPMVRESYVNLINTPQGGTHESGLREGIFHALRAFVETHGLMPKGVKLSAEDICGRMSFVLSCKVLDPQFMGQTKDRLSSRDAMKLVSQSTRDPFELWLNENVEVGKRLAEMAIRSAQSRMRQAQKVEKKKSSGLAVLPGKLSDCESSDILRNELFLVEGDSAGGSAKMARNKETQALLPLRGKVLNTWDVEPDRLFANREIHDISTALGIDPHASTDFDLSGLRYGKVIIMSDADVDGSHIQVLLLTLFLRHFPALVAKGHVFVAQPPLYRIDVPAQGKKRNARKIYVLDQDEREAVLEKLKREGFSEDALIINRFKGLGEMNPDQLWETTLNPTMRRLVRVETRTDENGLAPMFTMLMGKGESSSRKSWLEENGNLVDGDI